MTTSFEFEVGDTVELALSGERGYVIGRAEYSNQSPSYLVRYKTADGRQVENWQNADALIAQ